MWRTPSASGSCRRRRWVNASRSPEPRYHVLPKSLERREDLIGGEPAEIEQQSHVRDAPCFELMDALDALVGVAEDDTLRIQERVVVEALQRVAEPVVSDVLVRVRRVPRRFRELAEIPHHRRTGFFFRFLRVLSAV